jgi:hypothetical protein
VTLRLCIDGVVIQMVTGTICRTMHLDSVFHFLLVTKPSQSLVRIQQPSQCELTNLLGGTVPPISSALELPSRETTNQELENSQGMHFWLTLNLLLQ